jgi:hypothetical protein
MAKGSSGVDDQLNGRNGAELIRFFPEKTQSTEQRLTHHLKGAAILKNSGNFVKNIFYLQK